MKKILFGLILLGSMSFGGLPVSGQASVDPGKGTQPCEDSIDRQGELIVVTVCGRKTSFVGGLVGMNCNKDSDTSCTFTNLEP